jgi:hypothetical protein
MYVYICIYICIYIYRHICIYIHIYIYSGSVNEQFVYECIIKKCNIDEHTSYVDVGAGIGNTVIHVAMTAGCKSTGNIYICIFICICIYRYIYVYKSVDMTMHIHIYV